MIPDSKSVPKQQAFYASILKELKELKEREDKSKKKWRAFVKHNVRFKKKVSKEVKEVKELLGKLDFEEITKSYNETKKKVDTIVSELNLLLAEAKREQSERSLDGTVDLQDLKDSVRTMNQGLNNVYDFFMEYSNLQEALSGWQTCLTKPIKDMEQDVRSKASSVACSTKVY